MPDIEAFLEPISESAPTGEDIRYDIVYDQIRDARESDPLAAPPVVPDFREVRKLAEDVLKTRCKHLQVAAWLAEAWTHLEGVPGMVAGVTLHRRLLEVFWDGVFPEIDEDDGDLSYRAAPVQWMAGYLGPSLQSVPLTSSGLTIIEFQQGRSVGYEEDLGGDYEKTQARQAEIELGKLPPEEFDAAVDATPKAFYKALMADLASVTEAVDALDTLADERFQDLDPDDAPSFRTLKEEIAALQRVVKPILDKKLEEDPDPIVETIADPAAELGAAEVGEDGGVPIEPVSRRDAGIRVAAVARFLRQNDPHDPAAYLMIRGMRWGELRKGGASVDPRLLEAPPTATRTRLKGLLLDNKWEALLENAEDVMASPYGRGWLDLQRYVFTALDGLGAGYDQVEASLKGALRSLLIDLPSLPDLTLMDDTPTANRETRQWLQDEGLLGPLTDEEQARMQSGSAVSAASARDVSERARERVRAGQPQKAIELLMKAADQERSERGRSLRRAEAAGVMVDHDLAPVAMPILRDVMARIEEFRLEEWESPETVAVPMALLYKCIDRMGGDESEKQELYLRVCRLDPMQAILFTQDEGSAGDAAGTDGEFEES